MRGGVPYHSERDRVTTIPITARAVSAMGGKQTLAHIPFPGLALPRGSARPNNVLPHTLRLGSKTWRSDPAGIRRTSSKGWEVGMTACSLSRSDDLDLQQPFLIEKSADHHRD